MDMVMEPLSLVDLVYEKHNLLRDELEQLWNKSCDVKITDSEWQLLSHIRKESITISDLARRTGISRQATHKCAVSLREKQLLDIVTVPNNKRSKYAIITDLGKKCWDDNVILKKQLESRIISTISPQQASALRSLLQECWLD